MLQNGPSHIKRGFVIKMLAPNNSFSQRTTYIKRDDPELGEITINSIVTASIGKRKKRKIVGRVMRILRNEDGENNFVEILGNDGKVHKVDYTRIKLGNFSMSPYGIKQISSKIEESRKTLSFSEFLLR